MKIRILSLLINFLFDSKPHFYDSHAGVILKNDINNNADCSSVVLLGRTYPNYPKPKCPIVNNNHDNDHDHGHDILSLSYCSVQTTVLCVNVYLTWFLLLKWKLIIFCFFSRKPRFKRMNWPISKSWYDFLAPCRYI